MTVHFGTGPNRVYGGAAGIGGTNGYAVIGPTGTPGGGANGGGPATGFGGQSGTSGTGGGGGGGASAFGGASGGNGGSGIAIYSYPNEYANVQSLVGGTYSEVNGQRILRFAGAGSFTLGQPYDGG
jgi:hypothetical protein